MIINLKVTQALTYHVVTKNVGITTTVYKTRLS